jgi:type IV pilus assembly protein PilO
MDMGLDQFQGQLDKLAKLPRGARIGVAVGLMAMVAGAYVYFLYLPTAQKVDMANEQHLQLQRKLSEVRTVAANEAAVKEEIEVLEDKLSAALRQLPDSKELPVLLTDITSLGKNAGLDFKAFRPQNEINRSFYAQVPIDIEFTGSFHDVASFFDEISRLPRIVNIDQLDVVIGREGPTTTLLTVKGKANTFRFVEPEPGAVDGEEAPAGRNQKAGGKKS